MSEKMQGHIVVAIVAALVLSLVLFANHRDSVGLERSLHCATCSP